MFPIISLVILFAAAVAYFGFVQPAMRRRRYSALMARPFPMEWQSLLLRQVSLYRRLPPDLRDRLHGLIQIFLEDKMFEGCDGLQVTWEMKLAIAAQACVPMLARRPPFYPGLISILVYPTAFMAKKARGVGGPAWIEEEEARSGESWKGGEVVLSWAEVEEGGRLSGGNNVVLHEFAHQLDHEGGPADGMPPMPSPKQGRAWREVFGRALVELRRAQQKGQDTAVDQYGAENEAEFFACVVEAFFENPSGLKQDQPELYEQVMDYFLLDPVNW